MSDDNKAIAARALDCFNTGDVDSLDELVAPDAEDHDTQNPHRGTHGPDGFRQVVQMYRAAFPDLQLTVEEQIADGDMVASRWVAVVGFTGPPGVGKSPLIGALIAHARERDRDVAVLSIDPSSPFTQGALLGDRIRLSDHFLDPGVFIRSMASRGSLGGLSEATLQAALLMDASGKDEVYLETVGVGQAEVDIIDHADTVVLALMPGSGDSIQALKAGVMEIPDVIVVNKADHPLTDTMIREIRGVLSLAPQHGWRVPIVKTEASRGQGVEELVEKLDGHRAHIEA